MICFVVIFAFPTKSLGFSLVSLKVLGGVLVVFTPLHSSPPRSSKHEGQRIQGKHRLTVFLFGLMLLPTLPVTQPCQLVDPTFSAKRRALTVGASPVHFHGEGHQ